MRSSKMFNLRSFLFVIFGMTMFACGSGHTQAGFASYIGRPVSDLAMRMGPPNSMSHDLNGWPIFQWDINPTTGIVVEGLIIHKGRCRLEVATRPRTSNPTTLTRDWIMDNWRFKGGGCV